MKNRRLLAILIIFVVIGTFAILGSALFAVRTVKIQFINEFDFFKGKETEAELESRLLESILPITKGRNILFGIDREDVTYTLENEETRVWVKNIEAKFPNVIEIKVRERYPVYKVENGGQTAVIDGLLRVLDIRNDSELPTFKWPLIEIPEEIRNKLEFSELKIGEFLTNIESKNPHIDILRQLSPFFSRLYTNEDAFCSIFEKITFSGATGNIKLTMETRPATTDSFHKNYFVFSIENAESLRLTDMIIKGWNTINTNHTRSGIYTAFEQEYDIDGPVPDGIKVTFQAF